MLEQKYYTEIAAENETADEIAAAHDLIDSVMSHQIKLGEGKSAEVIFSVDKNRQNFCVKKLRDTPEQPHYQSIDWEMKIQDQMVKIGVRVPKPILALITDEGESYMVMETIYGKSLREMTEAAMSPPETYQPEKFWQQLKDMLKKMHEENIYHRDLHLGNIMMDSVTGEPILIDFGYSSYVPGGDDPYREVDVNTDRQWDFLDDDVGFKNCRTEFTKYLTRVNP